MEQKGGIALALTTFIKSWFNSWFVTTKSPFSENDIDSEVLACFNYLVHSSLLIIISEKKLR